LSKHCTFLKEVKHISVLLTFLDSLHLRQKKRITMMLQFIFQRWYPLLIKLWEDNAVPKVNGGKYV